MSTELYGPQSMVEGEATPGPGSGADPPVPPVRPGGRMDDLLLRFEVWRDRPALIWALGAMAAVVVGLGWWSARPPSAVPVEDLIPRAGSTPMTEGRGSAAPVGVGIGADQAAEPVTVTTGLIPSTSGPAGPLVVHVIGQVARPGLVVIPPGSRIDDAIAAAGGVTASADVERLNLAAPLGDGSQVRVPAVGEDITGPLVVAAPGLAPGPVPDDAAAVDRSDPVNLNTAGRAELESLPGVGPATAAAIIAWRTENGGFLTVEDLTRVPGIGPVKLAALGDLVTV